MAWERGGERPPDREERIPVTTTLILATLHLSYILIFFVTDLQYTAHPLEAVFLCGVGSLLGHHHDPLVPQHRHREHGYPAGGGRGETSARSGF